MKFSLIRLRILVRQGEGPALELKRLPMGEASMKELIPIEQISRRIHWIRGQKVMLDSDLARIYGVSTARLNEQVKRNAGRFPRDFMFRLTPQEFQDLISQIAIPRFWN